MPFALDNTALAQPATRTGVVERLDSLGQKQDRRVIGLMREADQLFVFREKRLGPAHIAKLGWHDFALELRQLMWKVVAPQAMLI